ncbi:MAG: lytic transglycosylase domain-containing protein [Desulfarculaceae bacterium]|nr:lytic transglycosylase domain-containing protein [Desulfarculaceae bacterium]
MKTYVAIAVCVSICLILPAEGSADIYTTIDADGVVHFTNVPTADKYEYKLYLKEKRKKNERFATGSGKYDALIRKASNRYGLDFSLLKAVIHVESGFNPRAVSGKGAKGLMQIMPENFERLDVSDPFDPSQNIMGGARYLNRLIRRYKNTLSLALAAYNAGPSTVDRYETIPPFPETRRYVKKVMKAYSMYK